MISACQFEVYFNLCDRFDDLNNRRISRELVTNVLAVSDQSYDTTLINHKEQSILLPYQVYLIGALRTYFKSKKSEDHKRKSGRSTAIAASCRKRQQRHNVSVELSQI